jgi:hypothetical protein
MTNWHGYFGIENIDLNNAQRSLLVTEIQALGISPQDESPAKRHHWRFRLDNDAAIFEALYNADNITVEKFKSFLVDIFSVDVGDIGNVNTTFTWDTRISNIITLDLLGVDKLRVAIFGGLGANWVQSGNEARAYIIDNDADWNE